MARPRSTDTDDTFDTPGTTGTIKRLIVEKGFGFLKPDGGGEECFFHRSDCDDFAGLSERDAVSFVRTTGPKGPRAAQVTRI